MRYFVWLGFPSKDRVTEKKVFDFVRDFDSLQWYDSVSFFDKNRDMKIKLHGFYDITYNDVKKLINKVHEQELFFIDELSYDRIVTSDFVITLDIFTPSKQDKLLLDLLKKPTNIKKKSSNTKTKKKKKKKTDQQIKNLRKKSRRKLTNEEKHLMIDGLINSSKKKMIKYDDNAIMIKVKNPKVLDLVEHHLNFDPKENRYIRTSKRVLKIKKISDHYDIVMSAIRGKNTM